MFCIPIEQCFICLNNLLLDVVTATLKEFDHANIFKSTRSACTKWRAIGWELGFATDELDAIVREPGRNGDEDYYEAMLKWWLDWAPPNHTSPSLHSLLLALRATGKERQANDLAAKYEVRGLLLCGARGCLRVLGRLLLLSSLFHFYIVTYNIREHRILKFHSIYFLLSFLFLPA